MNTFGRILTAMVTPFNDDFSINYDAAANLAKYLVANGSNGLVVAGSTGESATLSVEEKLKLFATVQHHSKWLKIFVTVPWLEI